MKKSKIIAISFFVVGTLITTYRITKEVFISPSVQQQLLTQASKVDVKKLVSDLCQSDFDSDLWDKRYTELFGKKEFREDTATKDEILFHLFRFTKSRGYFRKNEKGVEIKNGNYFLMMSKVTNNKNGFYDELNQELTFALQQIIFDEPLVGAQLAKYVTTDLPKTPITDEESCRSEKEKEEIRRRSSELYRREVVSKKTENQSHEDVSLERIPTHIQVMIPSVSIFEKNKWDAEEKRLDGSNGDKQKFIERKKKEELRLIKQLYRGLATYFSKKFPGVSISKIKVFTKKYMTDKFMFIKKSGAVSDAAKVENKEKNIMIMSSQPIDLLIPEAKINYLNGIYYALYPNEGLSTVRWGVRSDNYQLQLSKIELKESYITTDTTPDYEAFWQDGKLTGLILVSSNFELTAPKIISQYKKYYEKQGFKFQKPELVDGKKWFKEVVTSGELDYIFKEAHQGGNDRSVFHSTKKMELTLGEKVWNNGKKERVYLSGPDLENLDSDVEWIQFSDMQVWMRERDAQSGTPLFYVNSTCNSMDQAKNEVPEIANKLLIIIPSPSVTTTFSNSPKSTKYHILDGFRQGLSYEKMREGMKKTFRYIIGDNRFKFPDEEVYQKVLGHKLFHISLELYKNNSPDLYFMDGDDGDGDDEN